MRFAQVPVQGTPQVTHSTTGVPYVPPNENGPLPGQLGVTGWCLLLLVGAYALNHLGISVDGLFQPARKSGPVAGPGPQRPAA